MHHFPRSFFILLALVRENVPQELDVINLGVSVVIKQIEYFHCVFNCKSKAQLMNQLNEFEERDYAVPVNVDVFEKYPQIFGSDAQLQQAFP